MEWFQRVPKDFYENLRFREYVYFMAKEDRGLRRALKEVCKADILFYVNTFVWTFDPRLPAGQRSTPFITYQFQDEAFLALRDAIRDGENLEMRKSRTMGASWMVMAVFDYFCTYEEECKFFVLSRVGEYVDDKDNPDALFWKIDFIHRMLPVWLRPQLKLTTQGARASMAFNYEQTRSTITGGTTTKSAGIGGRALAICVDEFSRYEPAMATVVKAGLGPMSNCVIWPFTRSPEMGKLHPCQDLVEQGKKGDIRSFPMHWTLHPLYSKGLYTVDPITKRIDTIDKEFDFAKYKIPKESLDGRFRFHSPWFDRERKKNGPDNVISANYEFDDDINENVVYDALMIKEYAAENVRPPDVTGDIIYDELTGEFEEFVVKQNGPIRLWMQLDAWNKPPQVQYVTGADISLGVGSTNSCFCVARVDIGEVVLEFATPNMKPDQFAVKCVAICNWLNSPYFRTLICWERQGPGETFGNKLRELDYYPRWKKELPQKIGRTYTNKEGWTPQNNRTLHTDFEGALRNRMVVIHSEECLKETLEYENTPTGPKHRADRKRKSDPSGATVNHGDRVIAAGICVQMMQERGMAPAKEKESIVPGTLAWLMQEEQRDAARKNSLFPDWNRQRA